MGIYLALGTNLGDRRGNLAAIIGHLPGRGIRVLRISPVYETPALLPPGAPGDWNRPYLNCVIEVKTDLPPAAALAVTQSIETTLGRVRGTDRWSPRVADIDILLWHDEIITTPDLTIPHPEIANRAFVLDPLSCLAPSLRLPDGGGDAPVLSTILSLAHARKQHQPLIMGILNITGDSFSGDGLLLQPDNLAATLGAWLAAGVPVIDIGAESTRPGAIPLNPEQEWQRLLPCLDLLESVRRAPLKPRLSLDTYHPETAERALNWGFDIINDVTGLTDPAMRALIADSGAECIAMHSLTVPADKNINIPAGQDPVTALKDWLSIQYDLWNKDGINPDRIIFDPGIGFNKTAHQSLHLLRHLPDFADTGLRLLAGHSNKSFMGVFSDEPFAERGIETLGLSLTIKGADILRVHTPLEHLRAFQAALHIL